MGCSLQATLTPLSEMQATLELCCLDSMLLMVLEDREIWDESLIDSKKVQQFIASV